MDKIRKLEIKKLIKELDYIESDFLYKNEIISEIESQFISSVNLFLEDYPELKKLFDDKINQKFDNIIKTKLEDTKPAENDELKAETSESSEAKFNKIKKLYRQIVKATHPDKIINSKLNDIYINATRYYNTMDITGIYSICDDLEIAYQIDDDDYNLIIDKIDNLKNRINFIESTITWLWYQSEDETIKKDLIINYIKKQLNLFEI